MSSESPTTGSADPWDSDAQADALTDRSATRLLSGKHTPDEALATPTRHLLSFAVEEFFHASAFRRWVSSRHARRLESRLDANVERLLALLHDHGVHATFFVLGSLAETHAALLRTIADAGHEVAARTWEHRPIGEFDRAGFGETVRRSRDAIEQAVGRPVVGFRMPQGRLRPTDLWALDELAAAGFAYDSSMFPRLRELGGGRHAARTMRFPFVHETEHGPIMSFPLSTWGPDGLLLPFSGGNAMRQMPRRAARFALRDWTARYESPFNLYFNVWEFDAEPPRLSVGGRFTRVRQYRNLDRPAALLEQFFARYDFGPLREQVDPSVRVRVAVGAGSVEGEAATRNVAAKGDAKQDSAGASVVALEPLALVIPCYNESASIGYLAEALRELRVLLSPRELRLIFVDDGSTDDTVARLHAAFGEVAGVRVMAEGVNRGVTAAILAGVRAAETGLVGSMDADCTYDPALFAEMLPFATEGVACVTSSPYHPDGEVRNVPGWRLVLSKGLSATYRRLMRNQLYTYTSCVRLYRRDAVVALDVASPGFLGMAEIIAELDRTGQTVVEVPATLESRLLGASKMKTLATIGAHLGLIRSLAWRRLRRN